MDSKNTYSKSVGKSQKVMKSTGIDTSSMGDKSINTLKNSGFASSDRGTKPAMGKASMGSSKSMPDNC